MKSKFVKAVISVVLVSGVVFVGAKWEGGAKLLTMKGQVQDMANSIDQLVDKIADLRAEISQKQSLIDSLKEQGGADTATIAELEEEIAELEQELETAQTEYDSLVAEYEDTVNSANEETNRLNEEIRRLEAELGKANSETNTVAGEVQVIYDSSMEKVASALGESAVDPEEDPVGNGGSSADDLFGSAEGGESGSTETPNEDTESNVYLSEEALDSYLVEIEDGSNLYVIYDPYTGLPVDLSKQDSNIANDLGGFNITGTGITAPLYSSKDKAREGLKQYLRNNYANKIDESNGFLFEDPNLD